MIIAAVVLGGIVVFVAGVVVGFYASIRIGIVDMLHADKDEIIDKAISEAARRTVLGKRREEKLKAAGLSK